jgi:hypothetical protein
MTRTIIIAITLIASGAAHAGAILMCNEWGCRSSPYLRPPIVAVQPPIFYNQAPHGGPTVAYGVPLARSPIIPPRTAWPQQREIYRSPPPPIRREPPPRSASADPEGKAIERDILDFCDRHPDEQFCGRLGAFLRKHPEVRPRE